MKEEKVVIMYDSPEAAEPSTLTGWISKGKDGRFFYKTEHDARWSGCTHLKCDCGEIMEKLYTKCVGCRQKAAAERYNALPLKEFDPNDNHYAPGCEKYFFSEEEIIEYMTEHNEDHPDDKITELDLLICNPMGYQSIDSETVAGDCHEDFEPSKELEDKINEFNKFLSTLPAHSWTPGKVRTTYKLSEQD